MVKRIIIAGILASLWLVVGQISASAQTNSVLRSEVNDLKQQVTQLRAEVGYLRNQMRTGTTAHPVAPFPSPRSPELTDRTLLDRLAILAIEAKDRLNCLEERMARLETEQR